MLSVCGKNDRRSRSFGDSQVLRMRGRCRRGGVSRWRETLFLSRTEFAAKNRVSAIVGASLPFFFLCLGDTFLLSAWVCFF